MHGHLAGEALHQADDAGAVVRLGVLDNAAVVDRHEVGDHHHPGRRREHGVQEVGPVAVSLVDLVPLVGMDLPAATLVGVEDPAEDRRVVEPRQTEPVDAAVDTDQGRRAAVADQPVGADRQIAVHALRGRTDPGGSLGRGRLVRRSPLRASRVLGPRVVVVVLLGVGDRLGVLALRLERAHAQIAEIIVSVRRLRPAEAVIVLVIVERRRVDLPRREQRILGVWPELLAPAALGERER